MPRNRRDRERKICPDCGRDVVVTRSGRLIAHNKPDASGYMRTPCVSAAWAERHRQERERAAERQRIEPCTFREPHEPHDACLGVAPEFPSERVYTAMDLRAAERLAGGDA
jgi:hypothetical protein